VLRDVGGEVVEVSRHQQELPCPHCQAGEPSVWDGELFHYAHPAGSKLKMCHSPWRVRCLRCSAEVAGALVELCARHDGEWSTMLDAQAGEE